MRKIGYNAPKNLYADEFPPIEKELLDRYYPRGPENVALFKVPNPFWGKKQIPLPFKLIISIDKPTPYLPNKLKNESLALYLYATKYGPGSTIFTGTLTTNNSITWSAGYSIDYTPSQLAWYNVCNNGYYLLSVPFDIVTFPLQIPMYIYGYLLGRGMSPK